MDVGDVWGELKSMRQPTWEVLADLWISFVLPTQGGVGTVCFVLNPIKDDKPAFPWKKKILYINKKTWLIDYL